MPMPTELTWSCHACGEERPDDKIAVYTRVRSIENAGGATFSENIRYCVDRPDCAAKAQQISFIEGEPEMIGPARPIVPKPSLAQRIRKAWFGD
jgi:hypothetical protein